MITQHPIDLLPESMRAATKARAQSRRNARIVIVAALVVVGTMTHSRVLHSRAESKLSHLSAHADAVADVDHQREVMQEALAEFDRLTERYHKLETPLPLHRLLATIAQEMPASMSLDRLLFDADQSRRMRPSRPGARVAEKDEPPPRILVGELTGIAASDIDIAQFVEMLERRPPFDNVTWDFSREREIRGRTAREFRVSFVVDLEAAYDLHPSSVDAGGDASEEGAANDH